MNINNKYWVLDVTLLNRCIFMHIELLNDAVFSDNSEIEQSLIPNIRKV